MENRDIDHTTIYQRLNEMKNECAPFRSMLGPQTIYKAMEMEYTSNTIRLYAHNSRSHLMQWIVTEYERRYHTGTTLLLNVTYVFLQGTLQGLHQGYSKYEIIDCLITVDVIGKQVMRDLAINVQEWSSLQKDTHFKKLMQALSHRSVPDMALELARSVGMELASRESPHWDFTKVRVVSITGPHDKCSKIISGHLLDISPEEQTTVRQQLRQWRNSRGMGNSNVNDSTRNNSNDNSTQLQNVIFLVGDVNQSDVENPVVVAKLKTLQVQGMLVFGYLHSEALDMLTSMGIVAMSGLEPCGAPCLAREMHARIVNRIRDICAFVLAPLLIVQELNLGRVLEEDRIILNPKIVQYGRDRDTRCFLHITVPGNPQITVVLCGITSMLVDESTFLFWKYLHRLQDAISTNCILPGKGSFLLHVATALQRHITTQQSKNSLFDATLFSEFATCLESVLIQVEMNQGSDWTTALQCIEQLKTSEQLERIRCSGMDVVDSYSSTKALLPTVIELLRRLLN